MKSLMEFMAEKKMQIIFCIILAAAGSLLSIVPYALIYYIIEFFMHWKKGAPVEPVLSMVRWGFFVILIKYVFVIGSFVFSHIAAFDLLYRIRAKLIRHLGKLPSGFWNKHNSGRVRKVIHEDVETLEQFLAHHLPDIVSEFILPLAIIGFLFFVDWRMAIATLIPLPIGIYMMIKMMGFGKDSKRKKIIRKYHASLEQMHSHTVEFVQGMPVIKVFNIVVNSFRKLKQSLENYREFVITLSREQTKYWAVFSTIIFGGGIFIIPTGIYLLHRDSTDVTTVLLFLILGTGCFMEFVNLVSNSHHMGMIAEGADRIAQLLDEKPLREPLSPAMPSRNGMQIKGVDFRYRPDTPLVLEGIDQTFPAGSFTAIVGPSGAGKTTLVHLMARLRDPDRGDIRIGGVSLPQMGTDNVNKMVGTVFQDVQMLTDTVRNNILMGLNGVSQEQLEAAAGTAACLDLINALPRGWDTMIGEGGEVHLSGGEQQRIALARVVLKNPGVILLDEASSYADAENEEKMQQAFSRVTQGKTVIVIAHRLSTIVAADNILVVDQGRIKEYGTHEQLLEKNGIYTRMWQSHIKAQKWNMNIREALQ